MSDLRDAMDLAAALRQETERAVAALKRLTISDLALLADALEHHYGRAGNFQSATGSLAVAIMAELGVKVRVAEWHVVEGRCEHKQYAIGSTTRAWIGDIGDDTWIEAWIA